jgi:hypothetical protein
MTHAISTNAYCRITDAELAAKTTLRTIAAWRCELYDARQRGWPPPAPPTLTPEQMVDAYGAAMNEYGAPYLTFAEWHAQQQAPQPPRTYFVVGFSE